MLIIENLKYYIQHYHHQKYWRYRDKVVNNKIHKFIRMYYLFKIKKMDAFNNASLGTNLDQSAYFSSPPTFPHGLNGIIISKYSKIGYNCVVYHQVTIGSKDDKTAPCIGNNVIIYPGAKIIGNIEIGNNVIIGANAVVTKNFPDNCIIAGVPAKIVKKLS